MVYHSIDYSAVALINKFGFRGHETSLENGQIIVVGDSFTFGFGSEDTKVWPRLLENNLVSTNFNKKVYNLGVPGTDTQFHIKTARTYAARLKPSILILSILISDDLQQVSEAKTGKRSRNEGIKSTLNTWFPGWRQLYIFFRNSAANRNTKENKKTPTDVTRSWAVTAEDLIQNRSIALPDDIRKLFSDGQINLGLLDLASKFPERHISFWKQINEAGSIEQETYREITEELKKLNQMVNENGGRLIIFSMPNGAYVQSKISQNYRKYGFTVAESNFITLDPEIALEKMAVEIESEFIPSLRAFRSTGRDYFFEYDGHLNAQGNQLVSTILTEYLTEEK